MPHPYSVGSNEEKAADRHSSKDQHSLLCCERFSHSEREKYHFNMSVSSRMFFAVALIFISGFSQSNAACDVVCEWKASCNQTVCSCPVDLTLHSDGKNCKNSSCVGDDCLECIDSLSVCTRCTAFMSSTSGQCLTKCEGSAERKGNNLICTESSDGEDVDIVVAIVAGVGAGLVLCVVVILGVCLYLRKTRKKINLQNQSYREGRMEIGHVKQFPMYDNNAFETDDQTDYRPCKIDPLHYVNELENLRPHTDTLMTLLTQVKAKTRAMNSADPRISTYKGVIHQLCRVLVLLHKKDPVVSIPSDALSLLQWAQQMLDDHREQQSSSGGTAEYPMARISMVDDSMEVPISPVYATPNDPGFGSKSSPLSQMANPYSSVPVPLQSENHSNKLRSSRNSGYATIRRTPSIPNGEFISSVEDNHHTVPDVIEGPVNVSSFSSTQQGLGALRKEDFQTFLISSNARTSSDGYSTIEKKEANADNTDSRRPVRKEPPPELFNSSSDSYGDIDFSGGHFAQQNPTQVASQNSFNKEGSKAVILRNKKEAIRPVVSRVDETPPMKKNIITNPNAIKKPSVSTKGKNSKTPSDVGSNGYFANGHFYDPNPPSVPERDSEVYAPGSSYSERSNVMSTFLGDLPASPAPSESDPSEDGNAESDNSGGDLDVFPFNPEEATNPVEV